MILYFIHLKNIINSILNATYDLYDASKTPFLYRQRAYNVLMQLIENKSSKFDTLMLKNMILTIILSEYETNNIDEDIECRLLN